MQLRSRISIIIVILCLVAGVAAAQQFAPAISLPQDAGLNGLKLELRKLRTTARLMQTTAHPDDEDGGMLTLEARGQGATVELFTLTRGEGGQNRMGSSLFDELGVLRTLELLASDRHYGVQQRFSHMADFGFSKTPEESFGKWGSKEAALADMVRAIRTFRPDVIVSRFSGTPADGHGHHQAAGILTREAFYAAADPKRFPEQIKEGLQPWQASKLFAGVMASSEISDPVVSIDKGIEDPLLGTSYQEFALQGLRRQLSQGAGSWNLPPGPHISRYVQLAGTVENVGGKAGFFDGIDTTLPGLAARLGPDENKVPWLRRVLLRAESDIAQASATVDSDRERTAISLLDARAVLGSATDRLQESSLGRAQKEWLVQQINTKRDQLSRAAMLASGLTVEAAYDDPAQENAAGIVVPGQTFRVTVRVQHAPNVQLGVYETALLLPDGWSSRMNGGDSHSQNVTFQVTVPNGAEYTRPCCHRSGVEESVYKIDDSRYIGLPLTPSPIKFRVRYKVGKATGEYLGNVTAKFTGSDGLTRTRPIVVAPAASIIVEPGTRVVPLSREQPIELQVRVRSEVEHLRDGMLSMGTVTGWQVEPESQPVSLEGKGSEHVYRFYLIPLSPRAGTIQLKAALKYAGNEYDQGFSIVSRDDLETGLYYQTARQRVSVVDVKVLENMVVGYIPGAGDDIPAVLRDVGMNVKIISPEELASGELKKYSTIALGIRAYDVREDVRKHNRRLLDYVRDGGTLLVQYNSDVQLFNVGNFVPYPAVLGRERVTREDQPVQILEPKDDEFDFPNIIKPDDFDNWVQERGLYFMSSWDARYVPLLETHDPGQAEQKGGLLKATYGKGTYIYTSYAFFRQLPNGVPGAVRFFVNLLSAPNEWKH